MSKLSKLTAAIEKLDEAEIAMLEARRAFENASEYELITSLVKSVENAREIFEYRLLSNIETQLLSASQLRLTYNRVLESKPVGERHETET